MLDKKLTMEKIKYFAKLDGDIVGIDAYIRFEAKDIEEAEELAESQAEENYAPFDDPYDQEGCAKFEAVVKVYNPDVHDEYFEHINTGGEFDVLIS